MSKEALAICKHSNIEHEQFVMFRNAFLGSNINSIDSFLSRRRPEWKIIPEPDNQNTYDLFIAEVAVSYVDERIFSDGRWHFEGHDALRTIHHVAGGAYFAAGTLLQAKT